MDFYTQTKGTKSIKEYNIIRQDHGVNPLALNNDAFHEMEKGNYEKAYHILKSFEADHSHADTNLLATCSFFIGNYNEAYKNFNRIDSPSPNLHLLTNYIQNFLKRSPQITNFDEIQNKELRNGFYPEQKEVDEICNEILENHIEDIDISSVESLRSLCSSSDNFVIEKYAFALAENFFLSKNFHSAAICYNLAIESNPNKAIYRGFHAQTRFRMAPYFDRDEIHFITNLFDGYVLIDSAISLDKYNPRWYFIKLNILLLLANTGFLYSQAQMYELLDIIEKFITDQTDITEMLPNLYQLITNLA